MALARTAPRPLMGADGRSLPGTWNPIAFPPQSQSRRVSRSRLRRGSLSHFLSLSLLPVQVSLSLKIVRVVKEGGGPRPRNTAIDLRSVRSARKRRKGRKERKRQKKSEREREKKRESNPRGARYRGLPSSDNTLRGPPARRKPLTPAPVNQPFPHHPCECTIVARNPRHTLSCGAFISASLSEREWQRVIFS